MTGFAHKSPLRVCASGALEEGAYVRIDVSYAGIPTSILIFRYKGKCLAYRNQCVHMPRELDCEKNTIYDETGQYLRCSMHGIVYDPLTGASVSTMCQGEKLTPVRVFDDSENVWITDKRVKPLS